MSSKVNRKRRWKRRSPTGAPPGTMVQDPDAAPPVIRVIAYNSDKVLERQVAAPQELRELLGKWPVVWVNVDGLGSVQTIQELGGLFHLHRLVLEDLVNVPQRPKVERYEDCLFLVARMMSAGERLDSEQISIYLGSGFVLTFQERVGDCLDPVRQRIREGAGRIRSQGADYLAYALLDAVIDHYFPVLEDLGERLEAMEDEVLRHPSPEVISRIHAAKRDLLALRRVVWPQREALHWLLRESVPVLTDDTRLHLRDCYDHVAHVMDMVETFRELASGLVDAYQSSLSNRMNEVMKVLTIIATIFIPLSFLAGLYGMNFSAESSPWNMPELRFYFGYPLALAMMAVVVGIMLLYFRRKGWIGPQK